MGSLRSKYTSGTKLVSQVFTSSGTWNKPTRFIEGTLMLTGIGGGASGASNSVSNYQFGGNGGEWCYETPVDVSLVSSVTVTIGAGGSAATSGANGNSGGVTSFGSLVVLAGGIGATVATYAAAISVGGTHGGLMRAGDASQSTKRLKAQDNPCAVGGNGGYQTDGDDLSSSQYSNASVGNGGGGGGIVINGLGVKGADSGYATGGIGYGAGGGGSTAGGGAGASGVILLTWQEYI